MVKDYRFSLLMDYYKELLTPNQYLVLDYYYNQDFSLAEISEHLNITRQGVRDSIKKGERAILDLEKKLGMENILLQVSEIDRLVHSLEDENLSEKNKRIINLIKEKLENMI